MPKSKNNNDFELVIDFYNTNSEKLFSQYETSTFEEVHPHLLSFLPAKNATVLDIGSGSGRDAAGLAKRGYSVWAAEPSNALLVLAQTQHKDKNIIWMQDSLPQLSSIVNLGIEFDFVLISAVWSHLNVKDQYTSLKTISKILKKGGRLSISLRMQPFQDTRFMNPLDSKRTIDEGKDFGLHLLDFRVVEDKLNRSNLTWESILFEKLEADN